MPGTNLAQQNCVRPGVGMLGRSTMPAKKIRYSRDPMDSRTYCDLRVTGLPRTNKIAQVTCVNCIKLIGRQ